MDSSAITPWGSDPGWTLAFAPAQASGGQMRVPWAPEASTACSPPGEDRGQRAEATAPVLLQSGGLVSPRNILLTKANHRPSPKLRNGGSTFLFFSGRNCKVTRQGAWMLGDVENWGSELTSRSYSPTSVMSSVSGEPVLPGRAGVSMVAGAGPCPALGPASLSDHWTFTAQFISLSLFHPLASFPIFL